MEDGSMEDGSSGSASSNGSTGAMTDQPAPTNVTTIAGNRSVGVEWDAVENATEYRVHWSMRPGFDLSTADSMDVDRPAFVHRGLTNGTTYYYVVKALRSGALGEPSNEVSEVPDGEWVLEELGTGMFDDVVTGAPTPRIDVAERVHVLLFAEGYVDAELGAFHDDIDHEGDRDNDVDRWVDEVFSLEPYSLFSDAFVVWYIPRPSNTDIRDSSPDTAFRVPVDASGSFALTGNIQSDGETAMLAWQALDTFPFPPDDFTSVGFGTVRKLTASFLIFDPQYGRASVSGRALSLRNPVDDDQRLSAAFGVGHAHEFSHAFAGLRDEYMENDNSLPQYSPTSNVTPSATCSQLPWAHLLAGRGINSTEQLVGAFGLPMLGYHAELLCLMNGTHDNAEYYGGSGLLRVDDRLCNFCRELVAYRIFHRAGVLDGDTAFDTWSTQYRDPFYETYGFMVPEVVPQTNDVDSPASGDPVYEACTP